VHGLQFPISSALARISIGGFGPERRGVAIKEIVSFGFDNESQKKSAMAGCARGAALSQFSPQLGDQEMLHFLRMGVAVLAGAGFAFASFGMKPVEAACQLVTATHSAPSKAEAAQSSRALAVQSAYQLKEREAGATFP
jgi:hypothetical protein